MLPIGCMRMPSYLVQFRAQSISGTARFVPSLECPQHCVGQTFDVEVNQESVTDFEVLVCAQMAAITALTTPGDYLVHGTVTSVFHQEPQGAFLVGIVAGDAHFTLSSCETGLSNLTKGNAVAFIAHDLSFWDEAI